MVAVDAPSGVGVDDGSLPGPYIPADVTVTFGAMKPCAMVPPVRMLADGSRWSISVSMSMMLFRLPR